MGQISPEWIAVDWGTSNLRVWALDRYDKVIAEARSDQGMNQLKPGQFAGVLRDLIGDWDTGTAPIVGCGMVGARQGWIEAPYRPVPAKPLSAAELIRTSEPDGPNMWIVPGLSQSSPADVMRGEETQIAGFLSDNPSFEGTLCMPGTHTKWVAISDGHVTSFRTFMSGELFELISKNSVLRHSMDADDWRDEDFTRAVQGMLDGTLALGSALFEIRALGLVSGKDDRSARARLSGLIVGEEIRAMKPKLGTQAVTIIGSGQMAKAYQMGLACLGLNADITPEGPLTLAGLARAHGTLKERLV